MIYSIFKEPPPDFHPTVEVASCYCEYENKILLLKRHPNKSQGNTWGVPAGKLERGETPRMAVIREIQEEVGLHIDDEDLRELGRHYVRLPHVDYVYHMFCKRFVIQPSIILGLDEHLEAQWVTVAEASLLPLIAGGKEVLNYYSNEIPNLKETP